MEELVVNESRQSVALNRQKLADDFLKYANATLPEQRELKNIAIDSERKDLLDLMKVHDSVKATLTQGDTPRFSDTSVQAGMSHVSHDMKEIIIKLGNEKGVAEIKNQIADLVQDANYYAAENRHSEMRAESQQQHSQLGHSH